MKSIWTFLCLSLTAFLAVTGVAAAQTFLTPSAVNPAAEADRLRTNISLHAYHQGAGVTGSEKGGMLNIGIPIGYGSNKQRDGKYLFAGLTLTDRAINLTNDLTGLLRYAMRFQVGNNLFLSGGVAGGVDYTHVAVNRLVEDGGHDPTLQDVRPNSVRFTGQTGVQLHNDRFAVGIFGGFPYNGSHVGMNARFGTDPEKKFAFELYAYGYYYIAKRQWLGDFYMQGVIGRSLALGLGYNTDNYMQAVATLAIKTLRVSYACGFFNFSTGKAGINTIQHNITLGMTFKNKKDRENDYYK